MVCLPATQFGCGCTVTCGVKFILLFNLAINVLLMGSSIGFLIFGMKGLDMAGYGWGIIILGFCMAGVPIIIMAFNGVRYRNEAQVRMYLYYMWLTIAILVVLIVKEFVLSGPCQRLESHGMGIASAWACGVARYVNIIMIFASISILAYFQHVVYSHCEDLTQMGGGPELADLVLNKDHYRSRGSSLYSSFESMAESGETGAMGFAGLDGSMNNGLGGSSKILGGSHHEMEYPPSVWLRSSSGNSNYRSGMREADPFWRGIDPASLIVDHQ